MVFFMGFFLHLKKYCLTIDEFGIINERETFNGFTDLQRLLDRNQKFAMLKGNKRHANLPLGLKKDFDSGIVMPKKAGRTLYR